MKYRKNSISKNELLLKLRGRVVKDWYGALGIILSIFVLLNNIYAFQATQVPVVINLSDMESLYLNQRPENKFEYGKNSRPPSIKVGTIKNAGYEKSI
jgi:hypothetical protein